MDEPKNLTKPMTAQEKSQFWEENMDGFVNFMLRNGTDRGSAMTPASIMSDNELETLYLDSPTARRICEIYPEEMFRVGFTLKGVDENFDMDAFRSEWEGMDLDSKLIQAITWGKLYGGGGLLLGTRTGSDFAAQMSDDEDLDFVRVLGAPEMKPSIDAELSPEAAMAGVPEMWAIKPILGGTDFDVHHSRVIFYGGKAMPPGKRLANKSCFGMSVLQGLEDKIRRYDECNKWAELLLARLQQGVWKTPDLSADCETDAGFRAVMRRLNLIDGTRSASNTIAIDSEDEYSLLVGSLSGVTDLLKELRAQLSLYTGIPEVAFSSSTSGGLSNSAEGPLQMFWSNTAREQKLIATPIVQRLITMMTGLKKFTVEWLPMAEESSAAVADRLQKAAQADSAYVTAGVLSVEEIRETLRLRGDYQMGKNAPPPPRQPAPTNTNTNTNTGGGDQ